MKLTMIGPGCMGGNMVKLLAGGGHEVVVYAMDAAPTQHFSRI